jgi:hypothetical protein
MDTVDGYRGGVQSEGEMNTNDPVDMAMLHDDFASALRRARAEFLEMPGLRLTEAQAARLWASDTALCSAVLARLVEMRFLVRTRDAFARA